MGFSVTDWDEMTERLVRLTRDKKLEWIEFDRTAASSYTRISTLFEAEFSARVGNNSFHLGSVDRDGRAPFYLEVARSGSTSATSDVKDRIRSDGYLTDPTISKVSDNINRLWLAVQAYTERRNAAARDIIADLDDL